MTETGLREEVLQFANRYISEIASFGLERAEDTTRLLERRLASLRFA